LYAGHLDQLPFVEFVALVFLERVVVEFLGCQEDFRGAHEFLVAGARLGLASPQHEAFRRGGSRREGA
jgi:hypothetical protein